MMKTKELQIRPYARLLTMLGEQLIKNERIALIEMIKNSYDADAEWVKVSFEDFDGSFSRTDTAKIVIEDNGCGMTAEIIEKHWLNPATPKKLIAKRKNQHTAKGRVIQGEKGIGRYAMLKLGRTIKVITRPRNGDKEYVINYDFSGYDNEFLTQNGKAKDLFLDELRVSLTERVPEYFVNRTVLLGTKKMMAQPMGTRIEISHINGDWTERKVENCYKDITKLYTGFVDFEKESTKRDDFLVYFYKDDGHLHYQQDFFEKLASLLQDHSVLRIEHGMFDNSERTFLFFMNGNQQKINITDPIISGLKIFNRSSDYIFTCGSFQFTFYVFDFSAKAPQKYQLDKNDKKTIKEHRIYLYRDGMRVYPYGEPDDDWLQIDMYRGTIAAGDFLSNDQVVGRIDITQKGNPLLKDKTNREGLIEEGSALSDFVCLLQTFLAYIRHHPYAQYRKGLEDRKVQDIYKTNRVQSGFDDLRTAAGNNEKLKSIVSKVEKDYATEKDYLTRRFETAEDLAGVGLSVETASHDIMSMMGKVFSNLDALITDLYAGGEIDKEQLLKELQSIRGGMSFIEAQLKDIQLLFRSSKQRRRNIRVIDILQKVERIYKRLMEKQRIYFEVNSSGSPLQAKTTDAVLLQVLLNLFDNSIYWLSQLNTTDKKVIVVLDGDKQRMTFSDNGPGIHPDDAPYIFDSFYSGKGEDGRGLGLYIARQLLERNDYSIRLAEISSEKRLSGANFIIDFVTGGDE